MLTNERAVIAIEGKKVQSVPRTELEVGRRDLKGVKGDILLKRRRRIAMFPEIGFFGIANAQAVEEMASRLEQSAR